MNKIIPFIKSETEKDYVRKDYSENLLENYRGFNIIKIKSKKHCILDKHRALFLSNIVVARRCIDTYFNHLEMQENELSR